MSDPRPIGGLVAVVLAGQPGTVRYSAVPNRALFDRDLSPLDVRALGVLDRWAAGDGKVVCSATRLAVALGVARRTANYCLARLVEAGYVRRIRRFYLDAAGRRRDGAALTILVGAARRRGRDRERIRAASRQADAQTRRSSRCATSDTPKETPEELTTIEGRTAGLAACRAALRGGFFGDGGPPDTDRKSVV